MRSEKKRSVPQSKQILRSQQRLTIPKQVEDALANEANDTGALASRGSHSHGLRGSALPNEPMTVSETEKKCAGDPWCVNKIRAAHYKLLASRKKAFGGGRCEEGSLKKITSKQAAFKSSLDKRNRHPERRSSPKRTLTATK